jgi:hypothetical protein
MTVSVGLPHLVSASVPLGGDDELIRVDDLVGAAPFVVGGLRGAIQGIDDVGPVACGIISESRGDSAAIDESALRDQAILFVVFTREKPTFFVDFPNRVCRFIVFPCALVPQGVDAPGFQIPAIVFVRGCVSLLIRDAF